MERQRRTARTSESLPAGDIPYALAYYQVATGTINYGFKGALDECTVEGGGPIDLPIQPELKGAPVLTIFDKAPREYSFQIGMPLTAKVPGTKSACKKPEDDGPFDFFVVAGTPMAVYAPLPGGPVSEGWEFSGQGSGQQVPGTPEQTWQWNLSPLPAP